MKPVLDQLIREIERSPMSRYRLAQEAGVAQSQLSRLVNRTGGLTVTSAEAVADALGFKLVLQPKSEKRGRRK